MWRWAVDDPATPDEERTLLEKLGKCCSVAAPLVVDGRVWGEVYATRRTGEPLFDQDDIAYLEGLLAILAGALSRADRERSLSELAYRDPLTGLLNRRAIDEHAHRVFEVAPGSTREVGVVAVDINGLKLTNDRFGHQAGDRLIQSVARRAAAGLRPGARQHRGPGRWRRVHRAARGLPAREGRRGRRPAQRGELGARPDHGAARAASPGSVLRPGHALTPAEVFAAADRAQYVAKREHRRTTVVAPLLQSEGAE